MTPLQKDLIWMSSNQIKVCGLAKTEVLLASLQKEFWFLEKASSYLAAVVESS